MLERLVNDYASTLTAAWASAAVPTPPADFDVASLNDDFGNTLPAAGQFRVRIEDEIAVVTRENAAAGKLRVLQRGADNSIAAAHANGATIEALPTRDALAPLLRVSPRSPCWRVAFGGVMGNSTPTRDRVSFVPLFTARETIDRIRCDVVTAGGVGAVVRLGLYADDGGIPRDLIADFGTVIGTTTGVKDVTISQLLPGGLIWAALCPQGGTVPVMRGYTSTPHGIGIAAHSLSDIAAHWTSWRSAAVVAGALPATVSPDVLDATGPRIAVRTA